MHVLSLYGFASAASSEERRRLNRQLYAGTLKLLKGLGRVPIFIFGDFNPNPAEEDLVEETLAGTEWTDVLAAWAGGPHLAENTYYREGPYAGVKGKGATRPDRILANREAMALVGKAWVEYGRDNGPHALTYVELDSEGFSAEYRCLVKPKPWDVPSLHAI